MTELITSELVALTQRLGRLPTSSEALAAIHHNRTKVHAAWRAMVNAAELANREAQRQLTSQVAEQAQTIAGMKEVHAVVLADRETVHALADRLAAQAEVINHLQRSLLSHQRLLDAAQGASQRHRRDMTNVRLGLALLTREALHRDTDDATHRWMERLQRAEFRPIRRRLPDGEQSPLLAALAESALSAQVLDEIERTDGRLPPKAEPSMLRKPAAQGA